MCLSTVYRSEKMPQNVILNNVQRIEDKGGTIVLTNIMEQQVAVEGRILLADLVEGFVVLEEKAN